MQEYTNHSDTTFALRNISFRVPGRTLLHPLSLTFPAGKVTGLIGHNGSGKSTLLKMLGRHQPPSEGEILLDAQPLESWSSKAFARKVAYLPQQLPPAEGMTVRELVAIGRYPWHGALGRFGAADREKVEEAISLVGLKPLAHRLVDSLSGGERQRAWIAMLVAQDSRCLLLDEPTSALDIAHQVDVLALVHRLSQERGLTVIAVLHDINMAARYCDYLVALRGGEMIAQGTPAEIMRFPAGKVTGLIGHNGSGKSTLLKMLGRHQPPSEGEILLDAQPLESWSSKAFARKVAYLPQQLPPAEGMTVRELVAIGRYPWHGALGRFGAADREKVEEAISLVGLKPLAHRLVDSLSGGERQRAWIAMLVAQDSRCLLLDEPTSALDIAHQVDVLALVHRLSQERGLTVIAVLHDINMAARYCDYLVALRGGEMIAQGTPAEIMRGETLEMIYGIPMGILPHPAGAAPVSFVY